MNIYTLAKFPLSSRSSHIDCIANARNIVRNITAGGVFKKSFSKELGSLDDKMEDAGR